MPKIRKLPGKPGSIYPVNIKTLEAESNLRQTYFRNREYLSHSALLRWSANKVGQVHSQFREDRL